MENLITKFWNGKVPLWKSYWLVGELLNAIFMLSIIIEISFRQVPNFALL